MQPLITKLADITLINNTYVPKAAANNTSVDTALNILFSILGAMAFLVILISGLNYVFSSGEPEKVARAKSTIIYAIIGLLVAALSFAAVKYVLGI